MWWRDLGCRGGGPGWVGEGRGDGGGGDVWGVFGG